MWKVANGDSAKNPPAPLRPLVDDLDHLSLVAPVGVPVGEKADQGEDQAEGAAIQPRAALLIGAPSESVAAKIATPTAIPIRTAPAAT